MLVDEWMYEFLKRRYSTAAEVCDWAYNLVDASLRYKYDADCEMFWKVSTITAASLHHRCSITAPSLQHHCTITAPSLHHHCTKHHHCSITAVSLHHHCTITAPQVITNQLDESVYWDEFEMTNGFIALLQKLDMTDNGGKVTGRIAKPTLLKAMRKWFPHKTDIRFNKLKRTLAKEEAATSAKVHYVHLFAEDKDFNQGPFAEMMRDQHLEEVMVQ